ncbi:MAG: hypothetical protein J6D87_03880, partial [Clostridia bacterium]|nr:hypothetical protein [Clostridia bacterium]
VHVPSLGMPRDIVPDAADGKYTPEDFKSSQCYRVEVYDDRIVLSGLDMVNRKRMAIATYQMDTKV